VVVTCQGAQQQAYSRMAAWRLRMQRGSMQHLKQDDHATQNKG